MTDTNTEDYLLEIESRYLGENGVISALEKRMSYLFV